MYSSNVRSIVGAVLALEGMSQEEREEVFELARKSYDSGPEFEDICDEILLILAKKSMQLIGKRLTNPENGV